MLKPTEPSLNVLISTGEVCRSMRSKKLFYQLDGEDASPARNAAPFWCSRTQRPIGPDGQFVALDSCRPGRPCCQTT